MQRTLNHIPAQPIVFGRSQWKSTRRMHAIIFLAFCFIIGCAGGEVALWVHHVAPVWVGR